MQDDELDFAEQQKQAAIQHKQQWEHDSGEKQRLGKMQDDHQQFQQQIMSRRQGEFEELQVSAFTELLLLLPLLHCSAATAEQCCCITAAAAAVFAYDCLP